MEFDAVRRILSEFCSCSLGKALARRIGPSRSPAVIREWLEEVTQMVRAVRDAGLPPFGGVTDITGALKRAKVSGGASGEDFARIAETLEAAANIRKYLAALPEELEALHVLGGQIGEFAAEVRAIRSVVAGNGEILDEASQRLASLRREIVATSQHVHDVIYGYLQKPEVSRLLQHATVTLHGDRYVLPVKAENRGRLPGVVHRESKTGATVFVEPNASVELNNRLSDLHNDERREIRRLLNQLSLRLQGRVDEITETLQMLAQIDVLSAKAQYAYQFEMTCPEITERGALQFNQARHPLLIDQAWRDEKAGASEDKRHPVVPIDIRLGSDFDLLVITGSNTGGKTVTLKTAALLVVMAQAGMHIPALRGAKLPVFRDVFIDVGDEQSLQQSLSTFGAHVKRIRYVLSKADKTSLVLLDELGAGTDPDEGGAIGQAVLDELLRIGCLGMVTTHLSVLKAYAFNHERVDNASVEFDTKTLSPTYHLRIGTPGESHAITVAKRLGLPRRITDASRRHLNSQGKQFRRAIRATGEARQVAEKARQEAITEQLAAQTQQEMYQAKLADLHQLREQFEAWLASLGNLKAGDEIFVPSLNKPGQLVRLELHKQHAVVNVGNLDVEVPLKELIPDLGQQEVREQIDTLRRQILDEAAASEQARAEADRIQNEYRQSLEQQKQRAKMFDQWLGAIARVKVGDVIPIARKPGSGKVVKVDLPALRATVETTKGELELSLQELFPQSGPFAPQEPAEGGRKRKTARERAAEKPMRRRKTGSKAAKKNHQALLATKPGEQVYVVPFQKRATLIRINPDKDLAVVQSGIFEMEIPLADLEPV
jgi:DNA mismatch repair protein MutS2